MIDSCQTELLNIYAMLLHQPANFGTNPRPTDSCVLTGTRLVTHILK